MGTESSEIALRIAFLLGLFLRDHRLGRLFGSDSSYQCFADAPKKVRRADVGFVRFNRLPGGKAPKGHCRVAPDLAVEVVSPNDTAEEVDEKVMEWLAAGVPLVWVVSPGIRNVRIHRPRTAALGPISMLAEEDAISGEDVLPGFSYQVREFFENT
jgi:Uma2 family endonuclease